MYKMYLSVYFHFDYDAHCFKFFSTNQSIRKIRNYMYYIVCKKLRAVPDSLTCSYMFLVYICAIYPKSSSNQITFPLFLHDMQFLYIMLIAILIILIISHVNSNFIRKTGKIKETITNVACLIFSCIV